MNVKQAVILAAGKGKRLDVFETPKPLVRVKGKALILWQLEYLQAAGIDQVTVVISPGDTLLKKFLADYPLSIRFVEQKEQEKEMLGSFLSLEGEINEPFFITVCDLVFEKNPFFSFTTLDTVVDIATLVSLNQESNRVAGANVQVLCEQNRLVDMGKEISTSSGLEVGIYFFTPEGYKQFVQEAKKQLHENFAQTVVSTFLALNQTHPVSVIPLGQKHWFDINTPQTLIQAEIFLQEKSSNQTETTTDVVPHLGKLEPTNIFEYFPRVSFEVHIERGIVGKISEYEIIPYKSYYSPHHLLVDKNIDTLYGDSIYRQLTQLGYQVNKILLDPGEKTKSVENYVALADQIIQTGIDKKSYIIAVGGGVVKDIAGFLAASLYRGIGFISIPTTVLSQADAAIALKQGVNGEKGKNLLGTYYAPEKIIVDPDVLSTLDPRYVSDGLAECIKQAFAQDKEFYEFFCSYTGKIENIDFLEKTIRRSVELKISSVQNDFNEEKEALVYQYGHEVGHAVEYLSQYAVGHGEGVAIGMRVSAEIAFLLGLSNEQTLESQKMLLKKYGLPYTVPQTITEDDIVNVLRYNKKFHGGEPRFVLVDHIGHIWHQDHVYTVACSDEIIKKAVKRSYEP